MVFQNYWENLWYDMYLPIKKKNINKDLEDVYVIFFWAQLFKVSLA